MKYISTNLIVMMKITIVIGSIMLSLLGNLWAKTGYAQSIYKEHIVFATKGSLVETFKRLEKQTDYRFAYDLKDVQRITNTSLSPLKRTVAQTLDQLLGHTNLAYKQEDQYIIIYEKPSVAEVKSISIVQDIEIKGVVYDDANQPLSGVSVKISETGKITQTDGQGRFSLLGPENATLIISYIGYNTQELRVSG